MTEGHRLSHDEVVEAIYIGLVTLPGYLKTRVRQAVGRDSTMEAIAAIIAKRLDNRSSKVMVTELTGFNIGQHRLPWGDEE